MSQEQVIDHYVMILNIEKITRTSTEVYTMGRKSGTEETRNKLDVAKVVITDSNLNKLIERGTKHLELVIDEGTNGQTSS